MGYKNIKRELERFGDEDIDELKESVQAVVCAIEARKSGKTLKEMVLDDVFSNTFWIAQDPMCYYLYLQCIFANEEELEQIENELLPQYPLTN